MHVLRLTKIFLSGLSTVTLGSEVEFMSSNNNIALSDSMDISGTESELFPTNSHTRSPEGSLGERDSFRTTCAKHHRFKTDEGICAGGEEESEVWSSGTVRPP